jgi:uncharacterized protein (DUF2141 family)
MRIQGIALFVMLMFASLLPAAAFAQTSPCPGIHVKILNIRNRNGTVDCALFDSPEGFPRKFLHSAQNVMVIKIRYTEARCDFEAIPPGTYALAVIHDENSNGRLDSNLSASQRKATVFQTMPRLCSARLRSLTPASRTTDRAWT